MATCVIALVGEAPCQCFSTCAHQGAHYPTGQSGSRRTIKSQSENAADVVAFE
jgi:hypothetical protein